MQKAEFQEASRAQLSLLAPLEKKALIWLARHAPGWINSDHLTALGLASLAGAGLSYWFARWNTAGLWLVILFLSLNWLGDSLDGTLARVRNQQRPRYGFYIDHMVDTFGAFALTMGLAMSGYVHWLIAAGVLAGFYILSIESYLATYTIGKFHLSHGIFGPTEIRIALMVGNAVLTVNPYAHLGGRTVPLFDLGGVVAIAGMAVMATVATVRHGVALYQEE